MSKFLALNGLLNSHCSVLYILSMYIWKNSGHTFRDDVIGEDFLNYQSLPMRRTAQTIEVIEGTQRVDTLNKITEERVMNLRRSQGWAWMEFEGRERVIEVIHIVFVYKIL